MRHASKLLAELNSSWVESERTVTSLSTSRVSQIFPVNHSALNGPFGHAGSSLASRTRIKTLAYDTILANARFFDNDVDKVPRMALTVGVGTVLESREVVVVVTGLRKALALSKAIGGFPYLICACTQANELCRGGHKPSCVYFFNFDFAEGIYLTALMQFSGPCRPSSSTHGH